jgi:hypothetical protein
MLGMTIEFDMVILSKSLQTQTYTKLLYELEKVVLILSWMGKFVAATEWIRYIDLFIYVMFINVARLTIIF